MTVQNDFLTFAAASGANVLDQGTYAGLGARSNGMTAGVAPSAVFNKVMRQMSIMAAVMAEMIVVQTGNPVVDDGTTDTITNNFINAVKILGGAPHYVSGPATIGYGSFDVDTSAGAFSLALPASPPAGISVEFRDITNSWRTNPLTLTRNGSTIFGVADDLVCRIAGASLKLYYTGSDWRLAQCT